MRYVAHDFDDDELIFHHDGIMELHHGETDDSTPFDQTPTQITPPIQPTSHHITTGRKPGTLYRYGRTQAYGSVTSPLFLGHGVMDNRVSTDLGRARSTRLMRLGVDVSWDEYEGRGHWYLGPGLWDLVGLLRRKPRWNLDEGDGALCVFVLENIPKKTGLYS
jgi:hypothetical protein